MARTGRPRKQPDRQQGHREAQELVRVEAVPAGTVVPEPPVHRGIANVEGASIPDEPLSDDALLLWDAYWLSPVSAATDGRDGVDRHVVEEWVLAVDELWKVEAVIRQARLVPGSVGNLRANPLMRYANDLRAVIRQARDKLGLSPLDRARLGIEIGNERMTAAKLNELIDAGLS